MSGCLSGLLDKLIDSLARRIVARMAQQPAAQPTSTTVTHHPTTVTDRAALERAAAVTARLRPYPY
ncbi:hypothetical protein [Nocardia farcinica]|uniref:hypothetical protein n=1 Tax=Nocardia farcinica TaxID=37329 RepID=UPI00378CF2C9